MGAQNPFHGFASIPAQLGQAFEVCLGAMGWGDSYFVDVFVRSSYAFDELVRHLDCVCHHFLGKLCVCVCFQMWVRCLNMLIVLGKMFTHIL